MQNMRENYLTPMSFKDTFHTEIQKKLIAELKLKNVMEVPHVVKAVINVGAGEAVSNKGAIDKIQEQMTLIAGQKPVVTLARKSVSAFKIRKGLAIGVKVTLRGERMYSFMEKFIKVVIPRLRDFRGISEKSVDQNGNLNIGLTEQTLFPEIDFDKIDKIRGLEITLVTNARNRERGKKLFELMGIPFRSI